MTISSDELTTALQGYLGFFLQLSRYEELGARHGGKETPAKTEQVQATSGAAGQ